MADNPTRVALCLVLAACQSKPERAPTRSETSDPAAQVSRAAPSSSSPAEPAPPPATRRVAPPLPDPLPGKRREVSALVGKATRVAIADLDGDGKAELVTVDADNLRVLGRDGRELAHVEVAGGIQVLSAGELDGKPSLIAGWGESREHRDATARVTRYRLERGKLVDELVIAPSTSRQNVVAAIPDGARLLVAYFDSKYGVTKVTATHGATGWTTSDPISIRMATSWALGDLDGSGHKAVVVGRLYGEKIGADGDAFVLAPDGTRKPLPTTRGVQSLAIADTDGDGKAEIFVGDGWHQNYIQNAQGLVTWIHPDGRAELIEDTPGQYTINQIIAADLDGDGKPELVTRGNAYVRVYKRTGDRWVGLTIAGQAKDVAVGDVDGKGIAVLVVGDRAELVDLHDASWR